MSSRHIAKNEGSATLLEMVNAAKTFHRMFMCNARKRNHGAAFEHRANRNRYLRAARHILEGGSVGFRK